MKAQVKLVEGTAAARPWKPTVAQLARIDKEWLTGRKIPTQPKANAAQEKIDTWNERFGLTAGLESAAAKLLAFNPKHVLAGGRPRGLLVSWADQAHLFLPPDLKLTRFLSLGVELPSLWCHQKRGKVVDSLRLTHSTAIYCCDASLPPLAEFLRDRESLPDEVSQRPIPLTPAIIGEQSAFLLHGETLTRMLYPRAPELPFDKGFYVLNGDAASTAFAKFGIHGSWLRILRDHTPRSRGKADETAALDVKDFATAWQDIPNAYHPGVVPTAREFEIVFNAAKQEIPNRGDHELWRILDLPELLARRSVPRITPIVAMMGKYRSAKYTNMGRLRGYVENILRA